MKKLFSFLVLLVVSIVFYSCSSAALTDISGSWKKPAYSGKKFSNLLVIAVSNDIVKRSSMENSLTSSLKKSKITATASNTVFPPETLSLNANGKVDETKKAEIKSKIESMGFDGVVVVSLLDIKDKQTYVPGSSYYMPNHYYLSPGYGFYGYWYPSYEVVSSPGYYVNQKDIFLETALFDLKTEELLWSAESETANPSSIKSLASSYSNAIVSRMISDRAVLK
jgi:hypothetical protein